MYKGYRIKINGIIISNDFISKGSYSAHRVERKRDEYHDAYGVRHETISPHKPMEISFDIRERNMREQQWISKVFEVTEDVPVTYWDDIKAEYKEGTFKIKSPVFKHRNARGGSISYDKTQVTLTEY